MRRTIPEEAERALQALQGVRTLLISYAGLVLQMPDMFPSMEKGGRMLSPRALVPTLLQLGATDVMQDEGSAAWATPPLAVVNSIEVSAGLPEGAGSAFEVTLMFWGKVPVTLRPGDPVEIESAGAYTTSYSSTFNGFSCLATEFVEVTDAVTTG